MTRRIREKIITGLIYWLGIDDWSLEPVVVCFLLGLIALVVILFHPIHILLALVAWANTLIFGVIFLSILDIRRVVTYVR